MPLQRARAAESRVRDKSSNGPRRVQSNACGGCSQMRRGAQSILQRAGIRQLPQGFPRRAHGIAVNTRWHRG